MFKISMKISKVNPKSNLNTLKNSSKVANFFRSIVHKKPQLSIAELGSVSNESIKEASPPSEFYPSIFQSTKFSIPTPQPSILLSSIAGIMMEKTSIQAVIRFVATIVKKTPISLGILGGFYALHQIYLSNIDNYTTEFEMNESLMIVY